MKAALAIAAAEVRALRLALLGGLLFGAVGHVMLTRFRFSRLPSDPEVGAIAAFVSVLCMQLGLAAVFGAGAVSRDLAERRLGFYLARPIAPLAYWGAKLTATFLVAYVSGWLMLLPGFLLGPLSVHLAVVRALIAQQSELRAGLLATGFMVAAAGAAAGAVRSGSRLLTFDIAMLAFTTMALLLALGNTWDAGTTPVVQKYAAPWLSGVALLVVLAAGAAQVCLGRLDLWRGHALLSTILWGGLLACVLGVHLFSRSVAGATPADLRWPFPISVDAPRSGAHVVLNGISARWDLLHQPAFFLDAQGQFRPMRGTAGVTGFAWSADGRHFAFSKRGLPIFEDSPLALKLLQAVPGLTPSLWAVALDEPVVVPSRVAWSVRGFDAVRALSPSGRRVLIAGLADRSKSVIEVDSGRTLARIDDASAWSNARFQGETTVRALREGFGQARVVDWDLAAGTLRERGAIELQGDRGISKRLIPTEDWQRVLRFDGTGLFLHDLDGRLEATLVDGWSTPNRAAGCLSGGRFGSLEAGPPNTEGLRLRVFDGDGRTQADVRLNGRFPFRVGGESATGLLAIGVSEFHAKETLFVDLATGDVVRRESGHLPALRRWHGGETPTPEPGSLATRLFRSNEGLVLLDPKGETRKLLVQRRTS